MHSHSSPEKLNSYTVSTTRFVSVLQQISSPLTAGDTIILTHLALQPVVGKERTTSRYKLICISSSNDYSCVHPSHAARKFYASATFIQTSPVNYNACISHMTEDRCRCCWIGLLWWANVCPFCYLLWILLTIISLNCRYTIA